MKIGNQGTIFVTTKYELETPEEVLMIEHKDIGVHESLEEAKKYKGYLEEEMIDDDWEDVYIYKITTERVE